jgi:D-glycero-alpha-D-manno-heptose-7-phosphate kinase
MLDHAPVDQVVVARAPLRIPLGGGGTDLPSHYRERGGFVVSAAIDRHVHVMLSTAFAQRFMLKHLEWEEVDTPFEIKHPILRAAVSYHWDGRPFELASVGDVPPGTGLGSSGAYTVCVLRALATARGEEIEPEALAARACRLEIERLGRSVGKQDQYAAAVGGVNALTFSPDESVEVRPLELSERTLAGLRDNLLLFFSGGRRSASRMLSAQVERSGERALTANLDRVAELARAAAAALEADDLPRIGELMREQWALKRERLPDAVTERIDDMQRKALAAGATGAVLAGAGGGGFLLVHTEDPEATRAAMDRLDAPELPFAVEQRGSTAGPA